MGFVADRFIENKAFLSEAYWTLSCECEVADIDEKSGKLTCNFSWNRGSVFDRVVVVTLYETCIEEGADGIATVTKVTYLLNFIVDKNRLTAFSS